jgi:hypothetical protein
VLVLLLHAMNQDSLLQDAQAAAGIKARPPSLMLLLLQPLLLLALLRLLLMLLWLLLLLALLSEGACPGCFEPEQQGWPAVAVLQGLRGLLIDLLSVLQRRGPVTIALADAAAALGAAGTLTVLCLSDLTSLALLLCLLLSICRVLLLLQSLCMWLLLLLL